MNEIKIILDNALAFFIGDYIWFLEFVALFILFVAALKERLVSSGLAALLVSVVIGAITLKYAPQLIDWGSKNPDYKLAVRFAFYMGLAGFDLLGIYAISKCNEMLNVHARHLIRLTGNFIPPEATKTPPEVEQSPAEPVRKNINKEVQSVFYELEDSRKSHLRLVKNEIKKDD